MQEIIVSINNRIASVPSGYYVVANNDEWQVKFRFDKEWDKFLIKAARIFVGDAYEDVWFRNDSIILPPFPEGCESFSLGVYASTGEPENIVYSSSTVLFTVLHSALSTGEGAFVPVEPEAIAPAAELKDNDTLVINDTDEGIKKLATIAQLFTLLESGLVTTNQLYSLLGEYRTAEMQDLIDQSIIESLQGKYTMPGGGIPKSDLSQTVQESLNNADTALQEAPVSSVNNQTGAVTITAAGIGAADAPKYTTLSLAVNDWQSSGNAYTCSKTVTGITATSIVWLSYSDTETAFSEAQSANTLTFTVDELPDEAITVNVAFMEGSALT